ncbi:TPA: AAA family ATPase [Yersinia enterocolitica]|uniref:ATP-dependent nuclease n=1 Tax=Yersinia enterocolitica TaxID=630 RepID=UPI0027F0A8AD|nr:DUF2813 domain-containing protein [Yersinia enterocolitica]HDM9019123.1 AAA family ATPase [Yersinia enterocolitica]HDU2642559.1 AAA family ATPase [Yersinia enterocolitica]HDW8054396.1 AAA family ATPase [Yersinia enterocolitica]HEF7251190.1 AAA family ATPase [Yersinia enterocolitica]
MYIDNIYLKGYRNYSDAYIRLDKTTLIIGANDVGKTNLLYSLRLLLDKSLSELDLEPKSNDFHIDKNGAPAEEIEITLNFKDVTEDAVISKLSGYVSESNEVFIRYFANKTTLEYKIYIGHKVSDMEEIPSRFYLKYLSLRYINSQRDLLKYIKLEKKHLLRLAQEHRTEEQSEKDKLTYEGLSSLLDSVNEKVKDLSYVAAATSELNTELQKLAYKNEGYTVQLDSGAIGVDQFIEKLELSASTNGQRVMLGGDGLNNQILLALWKAKSVREHDVENEVIIYCVEEPEAHLYPHQQRKISNYLINKLPGQSIVTSHSPQIAVNYQPSSIVKIYSEDGSSQAASDGCSDCISKAWDGMGYRISIIPAEAFFSDVVFLVEGPSEKIFYEQLAKVIDIDLDYYNISILSVDGIQFEVYTKILDAFNIRWVIRTDNDMSKIPYKDEWQFAGINRALYLCGMQAIENRPLPIPESDLITQWGNYSPILNRKGIFLSFIDLESDLAEQFSEEIQSYSHTDNNTDAAHYLRGKKAIRMRELLQFKGNKLINLVGSDLSRPLIMCQKIARGAI